jgi:hypothetical protein
MADFLAVILSGGLAIPIEAAFGGSDSGSSSEGESK